MHPIIFAVFGFIALSLAATFLGYFFGLAFLVADFAKSNPKRAALTGAFVLIGAVSVACILSDQTLLGCLGVVVLGLALIKTSTG